MVGKRAVGLWGRNEFLGARLPTLRRGNLRSEAPFALFCGGAGLRPWAWWASGRWGYGVGMNFLPPAYPPYEEEICVRKRLLRYFGGRGIEAMGMVGKRAVGNNMHSKRAAKSIWNVNRAAKSI